MKFAMRVALVAIMVAGLSVSAHASGLKKYPTETAATKACRSPVVWLNTTSKIYHVKGSKNYGATKEGAWVCKAAADRAGARAGKND